MLLRSMTCLAVLALALPLAGCQQSRGDSKTTGGTTSSTQSGTGTDMEVADAPIVVDQPQAFDVVVGSFMLRGTADVYEGNVHYELIGGSGKPTLKDFVTASCGNGCRGEFSKKISLKGVPPGNYTLVVFEPETAERKEQAGTDSEAKNGGDEHDHDADGSLLQIPLTVHRTAEK